MNLENANIYGNRIDELANFRRNHGRIVGEKYCKFTITKYNILWNEIDFNYDIIRS
jgi:hypothetical protein